MTGRGGPSAVEVGRAREARRAAILIIAVFAGWMAANWIGGALGLPPALALALDAAALAVLGWVLVGLIGLWRARRKEGH